MARSRKLYRLNEGDQAIFQKARVDGPNWFTSYYLRGDNTGTWWHPGAISDKWRNGYNTLLTAWKTARKPSEFEYAGSEYLAKYPEPGQTLPSFHHHHGFLFQEWQNRMVTSKQRIRVVFGGYGSGKTYAAIADMLYKAATVPGYRGLVLTPNSTQIGEVHTQALRIIEGTLFHERFFIDASEKPFPKLYIGNNYVGRNIIQFFPIGDPIGVAKILSLTIDECIVDQAEQIFDIEKTVRMIGSRMRGQYKGRPMLGRMTFLANAADNDQLWDLFDQAESKPDRVWSHSPATWDNEFVTDAQLADIMQDVGGDEESIRVHMAGGRPIIGGEHFSAETLRRIKSPVLDDLMREGLERNEIGYIYQKDPKIGVWEWALPERADRKYLVVADPGYGNPPKRNAAVIMVFDYTNFPEQPATLQAFYWVFGKNDPWPWILKYVESVHRYRAHFSNAIDSTGMQSYYERVIPELQKVNVLGLHLNQNTKYGYLNLAKTLAAKGLFAFPSISGIFQQLQRYSLPDTDLDQDIVMALLIAAGWLENVFFISKEEKSVPLPFDDRYEREPDYEFSRYEREVY